jgi:molybdate transport system ATP-binding protein
VLQVADPGWDGEAFVAVNPRDITLYLERPAASARNTFRGRIAELAPQLPDGERVRVAVASAPPLVAEVMRSTVESLGLAEGQDVYAGFKATGAVTYR